jgi:signal transduction histidine kinase/FixJ family two-component response regulator
MDDATILVLDDEPGITLLCTRLLKRAGYNVFAFTVASEAYDFLRTELIDLLLVDIRMPDVSGFDVIERSKTIQPDIAVLIMTGFGTVETAIQALRQGVDGLLLKPFQEGSELVDAVKQVLADSQRKKDAARSQALRPLFNVTETLLSETHLDRLIAILNSAIIGHLRCSHAGCYQVQDLADKVDIRLLSGQGKTPNPQNNENEKKLLESVDSTGESLLVNAGAPGDAEIQSYLQDKNLAAAMFVPIKRINTHILLYAGRGPHESLFRDADLDMFIILANQAAVAIENARLYAELRDYVRQVEESQQALLQAEKMAAAGRLTASIAHEVNNPLQAVQNCLHLADRKDLSEDDRNEYLKLAKTELDRLMATVQRMLDFYRPGAVKPKKTDIVGLLNHVLSLTSKQLQERSIKLETNIPEDLPQVSVVSSQIQQVFINLILNAFDAMSKGGRLRVWAKSLKKGVEIYFEDTGPGITEDRLVHIFEPFYSTKDGGTGLGLTVSYNIITSHGGALEYISKSGPGTCFRVYLPVGG